MQVRFRQVNSCMIVSPLVPFGVEVTGIDLNTCRIADILEIGKLVATKLHVIVRNQTIDANRYAQIAHIIGKVGRQQNFYNLPGFPEIIQVTNRRSAEGEEIGLFPDKELDWHSNENGREFPRPVVGLYA